MESLQVDPDDSEKYLMEVKMTSLVKTKFFAKFKPKKSWAVLFRLKNMCIKNFLKVRINLKKFKKKIFVQHRHAIVCFKISVLCLIWKVNF